MSHFASTAKTGMTLKTVLRNNAYRAFHAKLGMNGRRKDESLQAAKSDRQLLDQK